MELVNIRQLSDRQNISVSQIRKLIKAGLPHYRVSKKILIDQSEFEAWFKKQYRVENAAQPDDFEEKVEQILNQFKSSRPLD